MPRFFKALILVTFAVLAIWPVIIALGVIYASIFGTDDMILHFAHQIPTFFIVALIATVLQIALFMIPKARKQIMTMPTRSDRNQSSKDVQE